MTISDGKFILELERAKEGERVSWVSVPRKTFWPPQGVATTVTCKQEGSTSLSSKYYMYNTVALKHHLAVDPYQIMLSCI